MSVCVSERAHVVVCVVPPGVVSTGRREKATAGAYEVEVNYYVYVYFEYVRAARERVCMWVWADVGV